MHCVLSKRNGSKIKENTSIIPITLIKGIQDPSISDNGLNILGMLLEVFELVFQLVFDLIQSGKDPVVEALFFQFFPEILYQVQLSRIRRQRDEGNILGAL